MKYFLPAVIASFALVGAGCFTQPAPAPAPTPTPTPAPAPKATTDERIHVTAPVANQRVMSPLTVTGEARGSWYFEASFPVKLLDGNGNVLVQTHADAQGDWMTNEFVPFKAVLTFSKPLTRTGTLVLEKDNPSDLPQNAASVTIPVQF